MVIQVLNFTEKKMVETRKFRNFGLLGHAPLKIRKIVKFDKIFKNGRIYRTQKFSFAKPRPIILKIR
jgi:hypothetical protein